MTEELLQQYEQYFDDCRPLVYRGLTVYPFTVRQLRECNLACHCLSVDPMSFEDLSLMALKRLVLILTVLERALDETQDYPPQTAERYYLMVESFRLLLGTALRDYDFDFADPEDQNRRQVIRFISKKEPDTSVVLGTNEFEELAELVLYQNGIDTSYRKYPAALRRELDRTLKLQQNKAKAPTVEKMIDAAFLHTLSYDTVMNLPVRKFYNLIANIQKREEYQILMSGMFTAKNVSHWMSGGYENDPYKGLISNAADVKDKFKNL